MFEFVAEIHPAVLAAIPVWLLFAWGAGHIARNRGEAPWRWIALGVLLGPFSWLAAVYAGKVCLHCRSRVHRMAMVCPYCQRGQTISGLVPEDLGSRPESLVAAGNFESDF